MLRRTIFLAGLLAGCALAAQDVPQPAPAPAVDPHAAAHQEEDGTLALQQGGPETPPAPVAESPGDPASGQTATTGDARIPAADPAVPEGEADEESPLPPHLSLMEFPWVEGNRVTLLVDGAQAFPAIFAAAGSARATLLVECYIFGDDAVGRRMLEIMTERARAGVKVRLILDGLGSEDLPEAALHAFTAAGGEYFIYHPTNALDKLRNPSRDHRKIIIADGRRAILGGLNLTEGEAAWHDFMLDIEGPAAAPVARLFAGLWEKLAGKPLEGADFFPAPVPAGALPVRVLGNQKRQTRWEIYAAYRDALRHAKREVIIANSYFIPDPKIRREFYRAVKRGVRVIVLLPRKSDIPLVQSASEYLYRKLLLRGVEIYLYDGESEANLLHAKVAVVDGRWLTVGSYNLDHQSLMNNLEVTAVIEDAELGAQLRHALVRDLYRSGPPLTLADWEPRSFLKKLRSRWWYTWHKLM
jgi:cardiolipin synthase